MLKTSSCLYKTIAYAYQKKFTGKIAIISSQALTWHFFFFEGKLTWIKGGIHTNRVWLRNVIKYLSEVDVDCIKFRAAEKYECHQYHMLRVLKQRGLLDSSQIQLLTASRTKEIFWDIFAEESQKQLKIEITATTSQDLSLIGFDPGIAISAVTKILQETQTAYVKFVRQAGILFSFNYAPFICDGEVLKQDLPANVYQNFVQYFDGKNTLKSIAFKLDKDLIKLSLSIVPYLKTGSIKLAQVEDLPPYLTVDRYFADSVAADAEIKQTAVVAKTKYSTIACIDDSPLICKMMNAIADKHGYEFLGVNNPILAVPQLIQTKPSLIFVDLAMPIINGYELSTQIKKVSTLKNIPLVMLTGKDAMEERVRAKVLGIDEFIGKPIAEEKIVHAIERYAK